MIRKVLRLALCAVGATGFLAWMLSSHLTATGALVSGIGFGLCVLGAIETARTLRRQR